MKNQILHFAKFSKPASTLCLAALVGLFVLETAASRLFAADPPAQAAPTDAAASTDGAAPLQREARAAEDRQLEGAWDIVITTTPNPPFAVPFRILRTVTPTGVVDAYAFPSITPTKPTGVPLVNTSGHGNWGVLDHGYYSVTVKYFQLNASALNVLDSVGTVRENIRMAPDGNSYTSVFETTIALPGGVTITNQGRTEATRIRVEPLLYLP
jgi:hypothetical protein